MTKYTLTGSENYAARIVKVHTLIDLPGLDNLQGLPTDGFTALVPKSTEIGSTLAVFPAGSALSEAFAAEHDLFRRSEKNKTPGAVGYLDDNGKVKALKLRGQISSALALPIDGPEGTLFDTIDGVVVSQKWVNPNAKSPQVPGQKKVRVSFDLPEHFDTASWFRNKHLISDDTYVTVTQKLHGTSLRVGRLPLETPLKWWERLLGRTPKKAFVPVIGSRRTVKFAGEPREGAEHFYGEGNDIWSKAGLPIAEVIPDGVMVYAEIIGYVGDTPIQPGYTYMHSPGEFSTYVYRVVVGGFDLSWDALKQFCESRGLKYVPELWRGLHRDFDVDRWMDTTYGGNAVPLDPKSPCDEGVTIRAEGITPLVLKAKSGLFLIHEGHEADAGRADIEEEEGVA